MIYLQIYQNLHFLKISSFETQFDKNFLRNKNYFETVLIYIDKEDFIYDLCLFFMQDSVIPTLEV